MAASAASERLKYGTVTKGIPLPWGAMSQGLTVTGTVLLPQKRGKYAFSSELHLSATIPLSVGQIVDALGESGDWPAICRPSEVLQLPEVTVN